MTMYATRAPRARVPAAVELEPEVAQIADDLYAILTAGQTIMGFIQRAGSVYVALNGTDATRAVEVGKSLSWDVALETVRRGFSSSS